MECSTVAVIPARAGSKGITRKNTRVVAGKPLIAWTIEAAIGSRFVDRIIVSTDDDQIAEIAVRFGAERPFERPHHLAQDDSPLADTIRHAARWLERHGERRPTHIVTLPPVSPLITPADIEGAVQFAVQSGAPAVASVHPLDHHPYQARRMSKAGVLESFMRVDLESIRRQEYPPAYSLNGAIYVNRSESIVQDRTLLPIGVRGFVVPQSRSLAIRTLWEMHLADVILRERLARHAPAAIDGGMKQSA